MATEKRLILLDHALQAVSENYRSDMPKHELDMLIATRKRLKSMPTAVAGEMVYGRWIDFTKKRNGMEICYVRCTICGKDRPFDYGLNYCPNCGAKMDGDGNA